MRTVARSLSRFLRATVLVAVIWLLVESRPPLPSATRLVNSGGADRLLGFVAWLGLLLVAIGLLFRLVAYSRQSGAARAAPIRHLRPFHREIPRELGGGYSERAFPLIPRQRTPLSVESSRELESTHPGTATATESGSEIADSNPPPAVRISVLGPLRITGTHKQGRRLRGATRELLAYLVLHPKGGHRDQIIETLWPDQPPDQGRNRLWRAAADARNHLGDSAVIRERDHYQLDRSQVTTDFDQLENALTELSRSDEAKKQSSWLEQALALFVGEPLAGSDLPWAESEQRRLAALRADLLERAGRMRLESGDASGALALAEEAAAADSSNERPVQLAIEAEAALGRREAVVERYERLRRNLDDQFGLEPNRDTKVLYRRLLGQDASIST
ncbi:MAG: hypothetical protein H0X39_04880 [Actinobacteria bacterium]|nr:hypothetical protein [Actinomycetota bacterium]